MMLVIASFALVTSLAMFLLAGALIVIHPWLIGVVVVFLWSTYRLARRALRWIDSL
jgi:hypothetical protein